LIPKNLPSDALRKQFGEIERHRRTFEHLEQAQREFERRRRIGALPSARMMNEIQESVRLMAPQLKALDEFRQQLHPLSNAGRLLAETLKKTFEPQLKVLEEWRMVQADFARQVQPLKESLAQLAGPFTQFKELFRGLPNENLTELFKGFSGVIDEFNKHLDAQEKRAFRVLAKRGWIGLEECLTSEAIFRLLILDKSSGKDAVDRFVCKMFRRDRRKLMTKMVRTWWAVPYLKQRRKIVRDAVKAHKEGRHALSIPALLPLADGLAVRIVGRVPGNKRKAIYAKDAVEQYHSTEREVWSECVLRVVTSLMYRDYDFSKKPPSTMNRHAIMHGEVIGYPTEANSLRVILLIDFFARLLRERTSQP